MEAVLPTRPNVDQARHSDAWNKSIREMITSYMNYNFNPAVLLPIIII
jgi:hypothetical protein